MSLSSLKMMPRVREAEKIRWYKQRSQRLRWLVLRRSSEKLTPGDQTEISLPRTLKLAPKSEEQTRTFLDVKRKYAC